jgi:glycosyltransferase involved in cell wall biosynthesis
MTGHFPMVSVNNAPRRVAYVHDTNVYGGVEVFMLLLIRYLDPRRYTPVVVIPGYTDPQRGSPTRFIQQVEDIGVPLIKLPVRTEMPGIGFINQIRKTTRIFRDNKFDVVHIHTCRPLGARVTTFGAWLSGIPVKLRTEHGPPLGVTPLTWIAVKPLDWMTDYILTVSDATSEDQVKMVHRNPNKLYRSYGGIELHHFNPDRNIQEAKRKIGLDPSLPVVGSVGRLAPEKGHTFLIQAASRIIKEHGPVNFLLVGEGPLEQQLRQQVVDLDLSQFVHITGYVPDLIPYVEAMDIGVMPSVWEGLGLALLEFMALGIPTVTSSVACFREVIVDGESGLIASLFEENSLADHILELLCKPDMAARMGQAALERVRSKFSAQRLADDMMDFYDKLLISTK